MPISNREIKRRSRANLNSRYGTPMLAFALSTALAALVELPFTSLLDEYAAATQLLTFAAAEIIISVLSGMLTFGNCKIHLNMARRREFLVRHLFYCYRDDIQRYFLLSLFMTAMTLCSEVPLFLGIYLLWMTFTLGGLLGMIGLAFLSLILFAVVQVQFRLVHAVALDHPDLGVWDTIRLAASLVRGNRSRLLRLYISFAGPGLLGLLSIGLGFLWVEPYLMQSIVQLYLDIIGEDPATAAEEEVL